MPAKPSPPLTAAADAAAAPITQAVITTDNSSTLLLSLLFLLLLQLLLLQLLLLLVLVLLQLGSTHAFLYTRGQLFLGKVNCHTGIVLNTSAHFIGLRGPLLATMEYPFSG